MAVHIAYIAIGFLLAAVIFITTSVLIAWTGPASAPPNGNISAPLNVGSTDQVKNAGLSINALAVFGNMILSGTSRYLNFGTTAGTNGYGFRDNNGVMEVKDSSGTWQSVTSSAASQQLHTGIHTKAQCESAGGLVRSIGSSFLCEISGASCPAGWTRLNSWGATNAKFCLVASNNCTTGNHVFSNAAIETCTSGMITNCTAIQATVGCY